MKYLAPIPKQFVDQNGLPLSNGKVHVYISGNTQYANVYQDADGEELMPNPASLDSNGAWLGFVTAGVPLDYVVEDKDGNVQFEYEKVIAGSGTANVAIQPVLTSGTKIAECWVDGELLELFAPEGGGGGGSYTAGSGIDISGSVISRKVQFVTTDSSYTYVRNIIDSGDLPVLKKSNGSMNDLFVCTMYRGSDIQFVGSAYLGMLSHGRILEAISDSQLSIIPPHQDTHLALVDALAHPRHHRLVALHATLAAPSLRGFLAISEKILPRCLAVYINVRPGGGSDVKFFVHLFAS